MYSYHFPLSFIFQTFFRSSADGQYGHKASQAARSGIGDLIEEEFVLYQAGRSDKPLEEGLPNKSDPGE